MQETQETKVQSLEGNDNPLQYPSLKNPMGRGACQATQSKGHEELTMTGRLSARVCTHTHTHRNSIICSKRIRIYNYLKT